MTEQNCAYHPAPADKRKYISDLGKVLVKDYGKKKYYKPKEVKKAHDKIDLSYLDCGCWGMSTYSSHRDFDKYHEQTGEICDYSSMKAEMLEGISLTDSVHLSELSDVDLDSSWLDLGDILDGLIDGIGDFFSGIADSFSD
jgi:hypothetical protein